MLVYFISFNLNDTKSRCNIGNVVVNHVFFADDIFSFFPSLGGLRT